MRAIILLIILSCAPKVLAAPVFPQTLQELINAINAFNEGTQDVVIDLSLGTPFLIDSPDNGLNALPVITNNTNALLVQNGTLQRTAVAPNYFRFFEIGNGAQLSLNNVTLLNGDLDSNPLEFGGAILVKGKLNSVINSNFNNNHALFGGVIYIDAGGVLGDINNTIFNDNSSGSLGGAIAVFGTLNSMELSIFISNSSSTGGAIFVDFGGKLGIITQTIYKTNKAKSGGAIAVSGHLGLIDRCTFSTNRGLMGGAIAALETQLNAGPGVIDLIDKSLFINNSVQFKGGAISGSTGQNSALTRPTAFGEIRSCIFDTQSASQGGTIYLEGVSLTLINNSTFKNSTAQLQGGVIFSGSSKIGTIENSTFNNNQVTGVTGGDLADGGVIFLAAETFGTPLPSNIDSIQNSTFSGNHAHGNGGVLNFFTQAGPNSVYIANFSNCTIADNSADGSGGAFFLPYAGTIQNLISTIVAKNTAVIAGPDVSEIAGAIITERFNLIGNNSGSFFIAGRPNVNQSFVGTPEDPIDPLLAPLANYGGPTETRALLPLSIAIDHGKNPLDLLFDQRGPGFARTSGPQTDIGAFEVQQPCPICPICPICPECPELPDCDDSRSPRHHSQTLLHGAGFMPSIAPLAPLPLLVPPAPIPAAPVLVEVPALSPPSDIAPTPSLASGSLDEPGSFVEAQGCSSLQGFSINNFLFIILLSLMWLRKITRRAA